MFDTLLTAQKYNENNGLNYDNPRPLSPDWHIFCVNLLKCDFFHSFNFPLFAPVLNGTRSPCRYSVLLPSPPRSRR